MNSRVLSPSYPDVLALRQGQASRAALRQGPTRRHPHFILVGMRLLQMGTEQ